MTISCALPFPWHETFCRSELRTIAPNHELIWHFFCEPIKTGVRAVFKSLVALDGSDKLTPKRHAAFLAARNSSLLADVTEADCAAVSAPFGGQRRNPDLSFSQFMRFLASTQQQQQQQQQQTEPSSLAF